MEGSSKPSTFAFPCPLVTEFSPTQKPVVRNKNLLFICPSYIGIGGVETVTGLLVDFFMAKGYSVHLLVNEDQDNVQKKLSRHQQLLTEMPGLLNSRINRTFIDDFIRKNEISYVFNQGVFSLAYLNAHKHPNTVFINTLHSRPFWEVIGFMHSSLPSLLARESNFLKKFKILGRWYLGHIRPEYSHPNIRSFYRKQIDNASWYVVLDVAFRRELEEKLYKGIPQSKIKVISNPLLLPESLPATKEKEVLFVGRLNAEPKRVDRLLRIWAKVEDQVPDWSLKIVGDGEERNNLMKMAEAMHLKRVHFTGFQPSDSFYRSASILCLTSTYEGAPMVVPEAQSFGTVPIVYGVVPSLYRQIETGVNGLIIKPFDEDDFAKEMLNLMQNPKQLRQLSDNALKKTHNLTVEKIGQQWLHLMKEPFSK
jgi:glycosyltransferase involved in cell wall biosynthesis